MASESLIAGAATQEGTNAAPATPAATPSSGEQKGAESKQGATNAVAASEPAKTATPDAAKAGAEKVDDKPYEFKAPEGVTFDPEVTKAFGATAKELGIPQEAAQTVLEKMLPVIQQRQSEALTQRVSEIRQEWQNELRADKEIGGDKLDANLALAKKAESALFAPEFVDLLEQSGIRDSRGYIAGLLKAQKLMAEDVVVPGSATKGAMTGDPFTDYAKSMGYIS